MNEPAEPAEDRKKYTRRGISIRIVDRCLVVRIPLNLPSAIEMALVVGSIIFAILLAEIAYRAYVAVRVYAHQERSKAEIVPSFGFTYPSPYIYHRELGYQHPPGLRYVWGGMNEGTVSSCDDRPFINVRGNAGAIKGNYDEASLKVLVFGDSFSAVMDGWDGVTWPHQLQLNLENKLGRSVHVVNFARPGQGVLEMVSHAAYHLPKYKPDLAIIAYITDDLPRNRHWRKVIKGDTYERMLMSLTPDFEPDASRAFDVTLLNSEVTREWCNEMQGLVNARTKCLMEQSDHRGMSYAALDKSLHLLRSDDGPCPLGRLRDDPVVVELNDQYRSLHTENCRWALGKGCSPFDVYEPVFFNLNGSMLFDRIVHGTAFASFLPVRVMQSYKKDSYADDPRFVAELKVIAGTAIPLHFVHLPTAHEMTLGKEYKFHTNLESLNRSIEELTEKPILGLSKYVDTDDPLKLVIDAEMGDFHPNGLGIQFYADAVARLLIDRNLVPPRPAKQ